MERLAGRGLLLELIDVETAREAAFNEWYEHDHLPARAASPGLLAARRFVRVEGAPTKYLALYDFESLAALDAAAPHSILESPLHEAFTRTDVRTYTEILPDIAKPGTPARTIGTGLSMERTGTRGLLVANIEVVSSFEQEFDQWYELEHLADRAACPGFLSARRFVKVSGEGTKFAATYDMESPQVLDGPDYARIAERTPWGHRVKEHWQGAPGRYVFREILPSIT